MIKPEEQLKEFLKEYDQEEIKNTVTRGRRIFLIKKELMFIKEMKEKFFSAGLPLGEATSKGFKPSFALLDLIKNTKNKVMISEKAEWLFLCGRDAFKKSIIKEYEPKERFLVINEKEEVLGIGKKEKKGKKEVIKNLLDRGDFLRREEGRKVKKKW